MTSSTTIGGGATFGPRLGHQHRTHGAKATITVKVRCPDGVTGYCAGVLRQLGGRGTTVAGRTDTHGNFAVRLKLHLSKAQRAKLRRFGAVKVALVFVQHMPDGGKRTTRRMITIK